MATTSIEWTDKTWNPITGCTNGESPLWFLYVR